MLRLDRKLLRSVDLGDLDPASMDLVLQVLYDTLELRVGMRLASSMNDQELDEFEVFIDNDDEAGALKWLEDNFPDYKQVVNDELDALKSEIADDADFIIDILMPREA
jgi:hypothetical protein